MGGGKKRREWPDKRFNNISLSLGCFNLTQDHNAGRTRLGSSLSSPTPTLSIRLPGATFPNREPSPTGLSRQRSCRSSQGTLTTPLFAENCSPFTYLGYIATASPEQRAAILLPALDCSILPLTPKLIALILKSLRRAGGANEQEEDRERGVLRSQHKRLLSPFSLPARFI